MTWVAARQRHALFSMLQLRNYLPRPALFRTFPFGVAFFLAFLFLPAAVPRTILSALSLKVRVASPALFLAAFENDLSSSAASSAFPATVPKVEPTERAMLTKRLSLSVVVPPLGPETFPALFFLGMSVLLLMLLNFLPPVLRRHHNRYE